MADNTKIEWTDATWNIINGCTVVSPGCEHCYAMRLAATRLKNHESREGLARMHKGKPQWTGRVSLNRRVSLDPIRWTRPRKIFVCGHGDLFHADVPDAWIDFVFYIALSCPQHTFQILTKRPERMREYMRIVLEESQESMAFRFAVAAKHAGLEDLPREKRPELHWPPRNCWLGTSVEDQQRADERIPALLDTPAAVRWLSCEPLLGPVDLQCIWLRRDGHRPTALSNHLGDYIQPLSGNFTDSPKINWVVAGYESGPAARPRSGDYARSLRDQCASAGVPFLYKQHGDWIDVRDLRNLEGGEGPGFGRFDHCRYDMESETVRVGKKAAGRALDGVEHNGYPA